jgi:hypothetical protein
LVSGEPQVTAAPGDQVTGNRSFKIKSRFQWLPVTAARSTTFAAARRLVPPGLNNPP